MFYIGFVTDNCLCRRRHLPLCHYCSPYYWLLINLPSHIYFSPSGVSDATGCGDSAKREWGTIMSHFNTCLNVAYKYKSRNRPLNYSQTSLLRTPLGQMLSLIEVSWLQRSNWMEMTNYRDWTWMPVIEKCPPGRGVDHRCVPLIVYLCLHRVEGCPFLKLFLLITEHRRHYTTWEIGIHRSEICTIYSMCLYRQQCTADQTSTSEKHVYIKASFRHRDVMTMILVTSLFMLEVGIWASHHEEPCQEQHVAP
jgi:hypothetical protein